MPIDRSEAREEALYAGLADNAPPRPRRRPRRGDTRRRDLIVGGVTLFAGLGILAGAVIQPELSDVWRAEPAPPPTPRVAPQALQSASLPPRTTQPAPIPLVSVQPQVAPPETAPFAATAPEAAPVSAAPVAAAKPAAKRTQLAAVPTRPEPLPETGGRLTLPPEMTAPQPAPARPLAEPPPGPASRPTASFDCAAARPGSAEQMVCSDPELAAADRRLGQAYGRAMRSGAVDPNDLDLDQHDWAALREAAAQHSRWALASVYAQRINELNTIADDGPGEDDPH